MFSTKSLRYLIFLFALFYSNKVMSNNIYFIDMDFLMNNSLAGKSIIKKLEEKNKSSKKKFKKNEKDLKNEESQIISQKNILSEKEYIKKIQVFTKKVQEYKLARNNTIENISKIKNNAQKNLLVSLTPILAEYASKNSISYIIPKQNIIIGKTEFDLTNVILKILDSKIKSINLE